MWEQISNWNRLKREYEKKIGENEYMYIYLEVCYNKMSNGIVVKVLKEGFLRWENTYCIVCIDGVIKQ